MKDVKVVYGTGDKSDAIDAFYKFADTSGRK